MSSANPYGPQPGQPGPVPGPQGQPVNPYGSAPPPGSGYTFGPFAPGPGGPPPGGFPPGGGYGGPPGGALPPAPPGPAPKRGRRIAIIAGAIVLVLAGGGAVAVVAIGDNPSTTGQPQSSQQASPNSPGGTAPGGSGSTAAPAPRLASDAVNGYLQALSTGDAQAALSYAADPISGPLLSNAVLADSRRRAPLTTVDVPAVADPNATSVPATYQLGETPVSQSFDVVKVGDQWRLTQVTKTVDVGLVRRTSVPMKINGVTITGTTVTLFPGSYAFTTGLSYLSYGSKNTVLLKSPIAEANVYGLRTSLTSSGRKAVVSTAKKRYQKCLKAKALDPSNCPFGGTSKYSYTKSTITWRQSGKDPFRKVKVTLAGNIAQVSLAYSVKISGDCRYQGVAYRCSGAQRGQAIGYVTVTKRPLAIRWL